MHDVEADWPMDLEQLLGVVFRAEGFFVAILADEGEGRAAMMDLQDEGVSEAEMKLYTSGEILAIHEGYVQHRGVGAKVAGVFLDDDAGRDLYLAYAAEGRSALWVRVPDKAGVPRVLRAIADRVYLHARYYGKDGVSDVHLS